MTQRLMLDLYNKIKTASDDLDFRMRNRFFILVDSDGNAFDTPFMISFDNSVRNLLFLSFSKDGSGLMMMMRMMMVVAVVVGQGCC